MPNELVTREQTALHTLTRTVAMPDANLVATTKKTVVIVRPGVAPMKFLAPVGISLEDLFKQSLASTEVDRIRTNHDYQINGKNMDLSHQIVSNTILNVIPKPKNS